MSKWPSSFVSQTLSRQPWRMTQTAFAMGAAPFATHARVDTLPSPSGTGLARIPEARELTNHIASVHAGAIRARPAKGRADFEVAVTLDDAAGQTVAEMSVTWNLVKRRD